MKRFVLVLLFLLVNFEILIAGDEFSMPEDIENLFLKAEIMEFGSLAIYDEGGAGKEKLLEKYICDNWQSLLDNLSEVPVKSDPVAAVNIIGLGAENLEPSEYLKFLNSYVDRYGKGDIPDTSLVVQLAGRGRKDHFLAVNCEHPEVADLLERVRKLVPSDNLSLLSQIDDLANGKLADLYQIDKAEDAPPPELLPGVKLRSPFGSLVAKFGREQKERAEATKRQRKDPALDEIVSVNGQLDRRIPVAFRYGATMGAVVLAVVASWLLIKKRRGMRL